MCVVYLFFGHCGSLLIFRRIHIPIQISYETKKLHKAYIKKEMPFFSRDILLFNSKFFLVAIIIALITAVVHNIVTVWIHFAFPTLPVSFFGWFSLAFAPVSFGLSVALPFSVMYYLSQKVTDFSHYRPIILSTFLGCWVGQVAGLILNIAVTNYLGSSYGLDILSALYMLWSLFTAAFSSVFFISFSAILFAYYNRKPTATLEALPTPPKE